MKDTLKKLIVNGWEQDTQYIQRGIIPSELSLKKPSLVLIGPRRSGKSYTLHELKDTCLGASGQTRAFIYLNFENERLAGVFKREQFDFILEAYYELRADKPLILLDEVQNIDGWGRFVRRLADSGYKVVVTGSNSDVLSRDIAEQLGGRFVEIKVYPLCFREFLEFKGMKPADEIIYSKERFRVKRFFEEYLHYGGFPEVALLSTPETKLKLLETYFNLVFYRDLTRKRMVENENAMRLIIKKLRESIGNMITPRAVYATLKAADIGVGPNTVEKYITYLEEALVVFPCQPFSKSSFKQERRKRYFVDNGYLKLFEVKEDRGMLLENLVFTELLKLGKKIYYHAGKRECDFISGNLAIQVTDTLSEGNTKRELEGLIEAVDAYGLAGGIIITRDQEKELMVGKGITRKKITVVPAWKWCLETANIGKAHLV